jgi:hypothetical protein
VIRVGRPGTVETFSGARHDSNFQHLHRNKRFLTLDLQSPDGGEVAGAEQEAVEHRLAQMAAYFPDARVTSYEELIGHMTSHPKDRPAVTQCEIGRGAAARRAGSSFAS